MGEVFLAEDNALSRKVALKLLPGKLTAEEQLLDRFRQEARSASALNHPNIITVYEIGEVSGTLFIATEFIEGLTLREKITGGELSLRESLEMAAQVADALSAAHEAGIVHRDIKPENIMIRPDGYIKVLDFGLAKLSHPSASQDDIVTVVPGAVRTTPGLVMGTAQYMSPEQARGLEVDARSDIFSLGVVLYEMLSKQRPFKGDTAHHEIVAILEKDPQPLSQIVPDIPAELDRITGKMLAKDREARYQSTKDLALDLKGLKRSLEMEAEVRRSSGYAPSGAHTFPSPAVSSSGATPATGQIKKHGAVKRIAWTAVAAAMLAGGTLLVKRYWPARTTALQSMSLQQLTETGQVADAVISPDGRYVVYTESERGRASLFIRQVNTGSNVRIQEPFAGSYQGLTFSADGDFVYFVKPEAGVEKNLLYRAPSLGGNASKVWEDVDSAIAVSPDRKKFAFWRWVTRVNEWDLIAADFSGGAERPLAGIKLPAYASSSPAWSLDGKWIAFCEHVTDASGAYVVIKAIPSGGGPEKTVGPRWSEAVAAAWLPTSRGILVAAAQAGLDQQQIWSVAFPGGAVRKLTNDLNSYSSASVTADGKSILTVKDEIVSSLWLQGAENAASGREITMPGPRYEGAKGIVWTPDGKIVYTAKGGTDVELWLREPGSGDAKQITAENASIRNPQVTKDGRSITFASNRTSNVWHLWRYDLADHTYRQLTNGQGEVYGTVSPDGKTVVYVELDKDGLWKQSADGGSPAQLTSEADEYPAFSPDGRLVAFSFYDRQNKRTRLGVRPLDGNTPVKTFDFVTSDAHAVAWLPGGAALSYICEQNGASQVCVQPLSGGAARQATRFENCTIFSYAWSPDGRRLAMSRGSSNSDVVLFRQSR